MKKVLSILLSVFVLFLCISSVFAAEKNEQNASRSAPIFGIVSEYDLYLKEGAYHYQLTPGSEVRDVLKITNESSDIITLNLKAFTKPNGEGDPSWITFLDTNAEGDIEKFRELDVIVPANDAILLPFAVDLPETLVRGNYKLSITATYQGSSAGVSNGVGFALGYGFGVYLNVVEGVPMMIDVPALQNDLDGGNAGLRSFLNSGYNYLASNLDILLLIIIVIVLIRISVVHEDDKTETKAKSKSVISTPTKQTTVKKAKPAAKKKSPAKKVASAKKVSTAKKKVAAKKTTAKKSVSAPKKTVAKKKTSTPKKTVTKKKTTAARKTKKK